MSSKGQMSIYESEEHIMQSKGGYYIETGKGLFLQIELVDGKHWSTPSGTSRTKRQNLVEP